MALPQQVINQLSQEPAATPGWSSGVIFFSGALLLTVFLVYAGITFAYEPYLNSKIASTQTQVAQLSQKISPDDQANLITFYSQISNLRSLLSNHIVFSQFFSWLEQHTESNVYFLHFSFSSADQVTLSGNAQNESDVNEQIAIFAASPYVQNEAVSNVGLSSSNGLWNFTVSLTMDPSLFTSSSSASAAVATSSLP